MANLPHIHTHHVVHASWISTVVAILFRKFDLIETLYEKTAWLRDLIHWKESKKKKGKRKK